MIMIFRKEYQIYLLSPSLDSPQLIKLLEDCSAGKNNDIKLLLSEEMNTVIIEGCHYAAFELLDQEVVGMQTDIFDDSLIRMKTGGYEEPDFEMTM